MFIVESRVADAASRPAVGASYSSAAIPITAGTLRPTSETTIETTTLSQPASSSQCLEPAALPLTHGVSRRAGVLARAQSVPQTTETDAGSPARGDRRPRLGARARLRSALSP